MIFFYPCTLAVLSQCLVLTDLVNPVTFSEGTWTLGDTMEEWLQTSLVPRPFPPPVLQYANTEAEGQGDLVTCSYVR